MNLITHYSVFGETRCWLYSVEWQKRGLPHAHILIWLVNKIRAEEIDKIISVEIPDPNVDPELFNIVTTNMIHGPCGTLNMMSPCMDNGKCTKRFPKPCETDTITNMDGNPSYRRRDVDNGGQSYELRLSNGVRVDIDNRWIVPYSPLFCKTCKAHINVELCSSVKSIKYICKYVHKGSDKAIFAVQNVNDNDEITRYQMGRYISSNEVIWRIFTFPIHERDTAVIHLAVHLENGQRVYFTEETTLQQALAAPKTRTQFFNLCSRQDAVGQFARTLMFTDIPKFFTWNKQSKNWEPRKRGIPVGGFADIFMTKTLGRLYTVHPKQRECFFLRLLLVNVPGPTSFQYLRKVNGTSYDSFFDACRELHLLESHTCRCSTELISTTNSSIIFNNIDKVFSV
ncbi:uncharacterized protein LOC129945044 [Eupeodes corollae]|uniref:uncharacterized protein LOC129945044 n=1 Tax=Eupeodes corollae TaxID=290404 RepID=UPI002493B7CD|nr:uncharacterized protein LOC129945044 [Eupeodes corollae]